MEQEIARLRDLATPEARSEWRRLAGKVVGRGLKGELLARSLAHLLQEKAHGTLSPVWQRRLATLAKEAEQELARASSKVDKLPPPIGRRRIKPARVWCANGRAPCTRSSSSMRAISGMASSSPASPACPGDYGPAGMAGPSSGSASPGDG